MQARAKTFKDRVPKEKHSPDGAIWDWLETTILNSPIIVGHNDFLHLTLVLMMKVSVDHIDCFYGQWIWVNILFCAIFVLELIFNVFIESIREYLGEALCN